jgi:hypothetical protein
MLSALSFNYKPSLKKPCLPQGFFLCPALAISSRFALQFPLNLKLLVQECLSKIITVFPLQQFDII